MCAVWQHQAGPSVAVAPVTTGGAAAIAGTRGSEVRTASPGGYWRIRSGPRALGIPLHGQITFDWRELGPRGIPIL